MNPLDTAREQAGPHWGRVVRSRAAGGLPGARDRAAGPGAGMGLAPFVVPAITAAAGAIASWVQAARIRGRQKTQASALANEAEQHLQELVRQWNEGPKNRSTQAAALAAFDEIWSWLVSTSGCGNMQLGAAGQRCITERAAGGTVPGTGGNWYVWYRDPIANDPDVTEDPPYGSRPYQAGDGTGGMPGASGAAGTVGGIPLPLLAAGGLLVAAVLMGGAGGGRSQ